MYMNRVKVEPYIYIYNIHICFFLSIYFFHDFFATLSDGGNPTTYIAVNILIPCFFINRWNMLIERGKIDMEGTACTYISLSFLFKILCKNSKFHLLSINVYSYSLYKNRPFFLDIWFKECVWFVLLNFSNVLYVQEVLSHFI